MKRVVISKSGREMYGPKWQNNMESSNISDAAQVSDATLPPPVTVTNAATNEDQTQSNSEGINRRGNLSALHQSMYRACVEGDYVAAEMLLGGDSNLRWDEISEEGDRALHVAAAMKHRKLVQKLVERMNPSELVLLDGHGYTACCYAAISGSIEIAGFIMRENPTLATARDRENKTPLQKAALRGNANMVTYFLKSAQAEDFSTQEWFDLLLVTIRREIYGVALEILGINEQFATMSNDEGTALHLLAGQRFFITKRQRMNGVMRRDMRLLAEKLWACIQKLGQASAIELVQSPPILHIAAEVGNVELITMLTHTYPHLIWLTNPKGYTIFHIAVKHRHEILFGLINELGARKDLIAISQDEYGNNILHLAAALSPPSKYTIRMVAFRMQMEMLWFEKVKAVVPPSCLEMKNKDEQTPRELFSTRHKSLLENSRTWIRNTADSCMLISTLIFTVVFSSAFSVPGGYNQDTGNPVLFRNNWFTCFVIFETLALFGSAISIICFLRIMILGLNEDHFTKHLRGWFVWGLDALTLSVFGAISAFTSAYFLVCGRERAVLIKCVIVFVYFLIVLVVCVQIFIFRFNLPERLFRKQSRYTLFKRATLKREFISCVILWLLDHA